ncbi:MAG TPA: CHAT domain-containing protein [Vicinamibacteria bacterium]|nr:CHAT domain-containing protein [Vicinamibacteria bacterium]
MAAALLLACACSRGPSPPARSAPLPSATPSPASEAAAHLARGTEARERGELPRARSELEQATALFEKDRNGEGYVRARNLLGAVVARQGNYKAGLEHLNAALATAKEKLPPGHLEIARSYHEIGTVYVATGRHREGLELLEKALAMHRAAGGPQSSDVSQILLRMGGAHSDQGDDERALALFGEAESIERALPGQPLLPDVLVGKGAAFWGQGRYDQAIELNDEAVRREGEGKQRPSTLAAAYINLGNAHWSKSDYDEALAYYQKALTLQVAALGTAHQYVGLIHYNMATLHLKKGDHDASIASAEKALEIVVPALGERHDMVVQCYNVLGSAFARKGDPDRALAVLEKARSLQLSLSKEGNRDAAVIETSRAEAYQAKGDLVRAARAFEEALAIDISIYGERNPAVAEDLVALGELSLRKRDRAEALRFFHESIAANTRQAVKAEPDLDPPLDSALTDEYLLRALKGAARARAMGGSLRDLEAAAVVYASAARLTERMRAGYRAEGSKLFLAETAAETFDEAIRTELLLLRLTGNERHLEEAYLYAERSKAGVLREALNEAEARSFSRIPETLLEEERRLRQDLAAADHRLEEAPEDGADEGRLQALRDERFGLSRRYEALQARFEKEFPEYYDLKYRFETVPSAEVRARALDERTALVEYFLGRDEVFIFTLTGHDLEVARVPREATLETDLGQLRRAIVARDDAAYARSAEWLYRALLAPVESRLAGKDLVIVPDGPLHAVPFEALLERETGSRPGGAGFLPHVLRDHAVSYAYSATVLLQSRGRRKEGPGDEFVGFAPGFDEAAGARPALPASRREVSDVLRLFRKRAGLFGGWLSGRSRVYLGKDATKGTLLSANLAGYRYVHLATHAIVDEDRPALSRLLLQPGGDSGKGGALTLGEIYNLRLDADLVVLSACDTGGGRIARGEGIIGLTRGFLFAGAKSLLVSLWPVSDEAAAALVVDFYEGLLGGRTKAQALREAKLRAMARNPEYARPFYWSSLVLVGDRR